MKQSNNNVKQWKPDKYWEYNIMIEKLSYSTKKYLSSFDRGRLRTIIKKAKKLEELVGLYQHNDNLLGKYNSLSKGYSSDNEQEITKLIRYNRNKINDLEKELEGMMND